MSTLEVALITAVIVSAFWTGALALVALVRSYREDEVTEEIRAAVDRLIRAIPEPGPQRPVRNPEDGRHHIRR